MRVEWQHTRCHMVQGSTGHDDIRHIRLHVACVLGQGLAREQWKRAFPSDKQAHGRFVASLEEGIANLRGAFPGRVAFGQVSGAAATSQNIQVWGANADNWNLALGSSIHGAGQAAAMGVQGPVVFGIVTTPVCGPPL